MLEHSYVQNREEGMAEGGNFSKNVQGKIRGDFQQCQCSVQKIVVMLFKELLLPKTATVF